MLVHSFFISYWPSPVVFAFYLIYHRGLEILCFFFQSKQWIDNKDRLIQTLHISCFLALFWMLIFVLIYNSDISFFSLFLFRCVCVCLFFALCWVLISTRYRVWRINLFLFFVSHILLQLYGIFQACLCRYFLLLFFFRRLI